MPLKDVTISASVKIAEIAEQLSLQQGRRVTQKEVVDMAVGALLDKIGGKQ